MIDAPTILALMLGVAGGAGGVVGLYRYRATRQANKYRIALALLAGPVDRRSSEQVIIDNARDAHLLDELAKTIETLRKQ
jgi:hypothetical protein